MMLASCELGKKFERPNTQVKQGLRYINEVDGNGKTISMNKWWQRIPDANLEKDIDKLLSQNLDLKQAAERIVQADERKNIQSSGFWPSLGVDSSASRSFVSGNSINNLLSSDRLYNNSISAGLNTSWQIDLFGKISKSVESLDAELQSSIYDREALMHSLVANLVNRRISIATNSQLLKLSKKGAENRLKLYEIVKRRYESGSRETNASDVFLAEDNYNVAKSDLNQFERALSAETYNLDVLLGELPGTTIISGYEFPLIPEPIEVPICMPADLLDRRPDLKSSELRVKAANAGVGVAIADLYPSLTFGGDIGYNSRDFSNLFTADRLAGSIVSGITSRIFEGGRLRANIKLQESIVRELAANYSNNVLEAVREVETSLKNEKEFEKEILNSEASVRALENAEEISKQRYVAGLDNLQKLLDIQQRKYNTEKATLLLKQQRWANRISLYLSLGGDWFSEHNNNLYCSTEVIYEQ